MQHLLIKKKSKLCVLSVNPGENKELSCLTLPQEIRTILDKNLNILIIIKAFFTTEKIIIFKRQTAHTRV